MFRKLSQRRLAEPQRCQIYDRANPDGYAFNYQSPDVNADHFCVAEGNIATPSFVKIPPSQIQLSIPTLGLRPYLIPSICNIIKAIQNDFSEADGSELPSIVVLSNGTEDRSVLSQFVSKFMRSEEISINITLICTEIYGKSNALNILHQHSVKNSSQILVFIDDDLRVLPGMLSRIYNELIDGLPRFVGIKSIPDGSELNKPIDRDIFNMIIAKRRAMGWPAPIGRFNAMPVSIFPTITRFDVYDDVFLSAFFMINKVPQYVLKNAQALYKSSTSIFEFIKRKRRIKRSDEGIIRILPYQFQNQYLDYAIKPKTSELLSEIDEAWLNISELLLAFAEKHAIFDDEQQSLDETDLSTKSGLQMQLKSTHDSTLYQELKRLKLVFGLT